jgi:hypothetical protein
MLLLLLGPAAVAAEKEDRPAASKQAPVAPDLFKFWNFDTQPSGEAPGGFSPYTIGADLGGLWKVQPDAGAPSAPNVVIQSAPCPDQACYQLLLVDGVTYEYPDVAIRIRLTGEPTIGSQAAGGLILGAQDPQNFYAILVGVSGETLEVVRVVQGKPIVLRQASVKPHKTTWHLLRARRNTTISKEYIEVAYDGDIVLSLEDKTLGTGQVGLVTRGDAMVAFDNLHAAPLYSQKPLSPPAPY